MKHLYFEHEEAALEQALAQGEITLSEFKEQMWHLRQDMREAFEAERAEVLAKLDREWGMAS